MNSSDWAIFSVQVIYYYKLIALLNDIIANTTEIDLSESATISAIVRYLKTLVKEEVDVDFTEVMVSLEMAVSSSETEHIVGEYHAVIERFTNLQKIYAAGERDFRGLQIPRFRDYEGDINLSGVNLSNSNLKSIELERTNLSGANLKGADLSEATLKEVNFNNANLTGVNLSQTKLIQVNLTDAILTDAILTDTNFSGCIMPDGTVEATPQRIEDTIGYLKRKAWKPLVKEGDGDFKSSKFGGKPWLNSDEEWPTCPNCGKPMRFFFQINLEEIPSQLQEKFGKGILQFFYCANQAYTKYDKPPSGIHYSRSWDIENGFSYDTYKSCHIDCLDEEPFPSNQLVRIVQPYGVAKEFTVPYTQNSAFVRQSDNGQFPPKVIINWQEFDDYPICEGKGDYPNDWEDPETQEIILSANDWDFMSDSDMYYPGIDKLAGWPFWIQTDSYPDCPICSQKMEHFIFQLISTGNINFMWGDMGIGYVLQCPEHKEQVTFLSQGH